MIRYVEILDDSEAALEDLSDFVDLCRRGMRYPAKAAAVRNLVMNLPGVKAKKATQLRSVIRSMAEVNDRTQRHIDAGFAYLFGLAAVQLWTVFEATMTDFCLAFLQEGGRWKHNSTIGGLKPRVADFIHLSESDQAQFFFELMMSTTEARYQPGAARFEHILRTLGLGGDVPDVVRRQLLWLSETRHILVHRKGVADKKYLERCPWVPCTLGQKVNVSQSDFNASRSAVRAYIAIVGIRLEREKLDVERPGRAISLAGLLERLTKRAAVKTT